LGPDEIRPQRADILGKLKLARVPAPIRHAARRVDEKIRAEVGFLLVFLDVVAIRLAIRPPVDVPDLIARIILPMLRELDAEALVRRLVNAGKKTLDEAARDERKPAVFGEGRGVEL